MSLEQELRDLILIRRFQEIQCESTRLEIKKICKQLEKEVGEKQATSIKVSAYYDAIRKTEGLWPNG